MARFSSLLPPDSTQGGRVRLRDQVNILRRLRQHGCKVTVVPATTSAETVLAMKPDGVFLSNGPGDPGALPYLSGELKKLFGRCPVLVFAWDTNCLAWPMEEKNQIEVWPPRREPASPGPD